MLEITKSTQPSPGALPDELSYLVTAFLPSNTPGDRSKAYLTLSAFCQGVRSSSKPGKELDTNTEALARAFGPPIVNLLADTDENGLSASVSFLTAIFQVDWHSASAIFQQYGVLEAIMDSVDLEPSIELARGVAQLLSQAYGHKPCRAAVSSQTIQWLNFASRKSSDTNTRVGATTALIKLSKGTALDNAEATEGLGGAGRAMEAGEQKDEDLATALREIVVSGDDPASTSDAVEGLAYLSVDPGIKEVLSRDTEFLKRLSTLIPSHKAKYVPGTAESPNTLVFGILLIVSNLAAYRPRLTEEQTQIEKLRQMAKASNTNAEPPSFSALDDDEHVKARVRRLLNAGLLGIFASAIRTDTSGVRLLSAKGLLSIVEDKDNRGKVLQSGGAKVLMHIIKHGVSNSTGKSSISTSTSLDPVYLTATQALAKLAITASPVQVFGPNEGAMYDAIGPFSLMLQGYSSTLLQRFESMMALTNLSSQSPDMASRIAKLEGLMNKVELLLLEDHTLVRRAAMELVCNLIAGSDDVFEKYGGGDNLNTTKSKLQVLFALSDVEDLPTRLAATGAVATLTSASSACSSLVALQSERHRVFPILAQLIDPSAARHDDSDEEDGADYETHPGLIHRAIVSTRNIFLSVSDKVVRKRLSKEAEEAGLLSAIMNFVKAEVGRGDGAVLQPAVEVLKVMMDKS
ncbi:hypothetical protein DXG03_008449 [Asterophora parasitica]|uniref:UNC-45/Cro1/She4 central domain-containing protein n=1 Tax=Asterophora parasitica TaxID=117018 RepID=A0A9P7KD79_9AGAR|nr:hypothetical protein DXG03_008449 [Asterophora parasitica]